MLLGLGTLLAAGLLNGGERSLSPIGIGLGLMSGLAYARVIIVTGRVAPTVSPWYRRAIIVTGGAALVVTVYPPAFLFDGAFLRGLWMWDGGVALFGSVLPIGLLSLGVPHIGPETATILGAAELPAAVFLSWAVLNEKVSLLQWLGVAVILLGIAASERLRRRHPPRHCKNERHGGDAHQGRRLPRATGPTGHARNASR